MQRMLYAFSPRTHWNRFVSLLILFVLLRGIILFGVLPLLEGWDEYQHIAYIQYLIEHDDQPVMHKSYVSRVLLEKLISFPQPEYMVDQVRTTIPPSELLLFSSS